MSCGDRVITRNIYFQKIPKLIHWKENVIHIGITGFNTSTARKTTDFQNKIENTTQQEADALSNTTGRRRRRNRSEPTCGLTSW